MHKLAKKFVLGSLNKMEFGQLTLEDGSQTHQFGQQGPLIAALQVKDPTFYNTLLLNGSLGAAQSYIENMWSTNNLTDLIRLFIQNEKLMNSFDRSYNKIPRMVVDLLGKLKRNSPKQARQNIYAHYDLGNEFFHTFLDETMMYSCALFENETDDLHQAQCQKLQSIIDQLDPKPGDHVLEIGTGWGTLAIMLAQQFNCRVTTTTISEQQYHFVDKKIKALGLQDKITLLNLDYRHLSGEFDKIVSIEMIEAVGHEYFDAFFRQCDHLLKPDGLLVIQAILINEQTYDQAKEHVDFIRHYIFPGGCLPSIHRLAQSIANHTKLQWLRLNDIGQHYVPTLLHWNERFHANADQVRALGFSDEFIRMWEFYFCYCAAGFQESYISDVQLLLKKRK